VDEQGKLVHQQLADQQHGGVYFAQVAANSGLA
jgi:hypothetical protein